MCVSMISEESSHKEEEIKRKLKSKPTLPQIKAHRPEEIPTVRMRPAPKAKTGIGMVTVERQLPLKPWIQLRPVEIRTGKPIPKELRVVVGLKNLGAATPKAIVKISKECEVTAELKPKILKVESLKILEPSGIGVLARPLPEEGLKPHLRPLRRVSLESIRIPVVKPPEFVIKPATPAHLKPIERSLLTEETIESTKTMIEEPPEISEKDVFIPPFLEKLSFATEITGRPICVILSKGADDSFVHSVALICREIYRIVKGGKPSPRWISKGLKEEIERNLKAEDSIFVVDDSKCEFLPDFGKIRSASELLEKVNIDMVYDRLHEFFSQDFGFIIFHVNKKWASEFARMLQEKVGAYANIIEVLSPNWQQEVMVAVAGACWGFTEEKGQTFDEIFGRCEKSFFSELETAGKDDKLIHWIKEDESAGYEHEGMKAIVVECLAKELGATGKDDIVRMLKDKTIETERELDGGMRIDVYLSTQSIHRAVEIETFYGRGDPIKRLDKDTLSKYKGGDRVDVVLLTGVQALLYARRLIKLANIYRKDRNIRVNFYLPNIRERKLVPLRDVFHMLKNVVTPSTEDDDKCLWSEFSQALRENGIDPSEYKNFFALTLDRSKSYQENLSFMLEKIKLETKLLKEQKGEVV